jgi:hypothetical protein
MFRAVTRYLPLLAGVVLVDLNVPAAGAAQSANVVAAQGAVVEVRSVKFATVRAPGASEPWLEATVELAVTAAPGGGQASRFADRVQVMLNLSLGAEDSGFFRASCEAVALEAGRAAVRFYLPPEILRREQVNTDPYAYAAEVIVRGRPVPLSAGAISSNVRSPDALRSFKDRVAQAAPLNDGVLVPQYLSPFAGVYPGDTPSFVRRER